MRLFGYVTKIVDNKNQVWEVMNMVVGLRTKVVSLQNGTVYRGIEGRRLAR